MSATYIICSEITLSQNGLILRQELASIVKSVQDSLKKLCRTLLTFLDSANVSNLRSINLVTKKSGLPDKKTNDLLTNETVDNYICYFGIIHKIMTRIRSHKSK